MTAIPDEAVEAACEAFAQAPFLIEHRAQMELALAAAASHLMAQAVESAAHAFAASTPEGDYSSTPTQVIDWLREYASGYREATK